MRYLALAVDYDGTLATHGSVPDDVVTALERLRDTGRKVVLVTGRTLDDLRTHFTRTDVFDRVVGENGAVVADPSTGEERTLAEPVPREFVDGLRDRGVGPIGVGRVIVATHEPNETAALQVIRELGLDLQVIFNKGAVMILPANVTKATGLQAALEDLELSPHNVVGIGDAENDHAFLDLCESSVAVANALSAVRKRADVVTRGTHGEGVKQLVDWLIEHDLADLESRLKRHRIALGPHAGSRKQVALNPFGTRLVVAGSSRSGKSSLVLGLIERILSHGYQFCLVDPEGDYERLPATIGLGDTHQAPRPEEVVEVLRRPTENVCVNLLAVPGEHRPDYFANLLGMLEDLRNRSGRPHWLIVDEAHHVLPARGGDERRVPDFGAVVLVTLDPRHLDPLVLKRMNIVLAVGKQPRTTLSVAADVLGEGAPRAIARDLRKGEALLWQRGKKRSHLIELLPSTLKRRRHRRKYTEGELPPDRSFYFRGPDGGVSVRAYNLYVFAELAQTVDDTTWQHHLAEGDFSQWIETSVKDRKLAKDIARVERDAELDPATSRKEVRALIEQRYAPPA